MLGTNTGAWLEMYQCKVTKVDVVKIAQFRDKFISQLIPNSANFPGTHKCPIHHGNFETVLLGSMGKILPAQWHQPKKHKQRRNWKHSRNALLYRERPNHMCTLWNTKWTSSTTRKHEGKTYLQGGSTDRMVQQSRRNCSLQRKI